MKGQLTLFEPEFINDRTALQRYSSYPWRPDEPIYGNGRRLTPRIPGRMDSEHMKRIFLPHLLPLEEYDLIAVLLSGERTVSSAIISC